MSSNFNNAKIINVYYNKGDRKPYDVNGKPIAYIGEEFVGSNESSEIRFFFGQDLDSATPIIITKRPDGQTYLDLCEKIGTGVNSYYRVFLNDWYAEVKGKLTIVFKVYNGSVTFNEGNTEILTASGQVIVSDIFNLEVGYAPLATSAVPPFDPSPETSWYFALSQKLDKAQSITVTGALPTLTGDVYDDRYFYVENEGVGRLYYINGSTAIEVVWQVGTLRLTPTGNGEVTADTGKLSWNQPNGTVNVGLYNNVNVGVGEDVMYYGKASATITKGQVIQFGGYQGDHILIKPAVPSEINANPKLIIGIAKQAITSGDFGYVAHFGKIEGYDSGSFAVGSLLWFNSGSGSNGLLTATQPTAPNAKILMAALIKAETSGAANNGVLQVRITIEPKLDELQNVLITSATNGNVLSYDGTKWVNSTRLTTAETDIDALQGRMTAEEANVDNLQGRMTSAEGDIDDIESGATIVPRALGDQNGNTINTTYLTQSSASATYIPLSQKAQANGVATLGADGRVISSQIPGIVSSVEEYDTLEDFPEVGVLTTVYLALDTGLTYLWSGSNYVALSSSLALGETSTTAYRGDRGKIAYDYSQVGHLPLAGGTVTGNLVVGGDLTISGTTTTIDTETVGIKDNLILINSNQTGVPSTALKGGLEIERGDLTNFQFVFDENDDRFKVGQVGSLQTVATRTDDGTIANRGITFFNTSTNRLENNANIVIDSANNVGIGTTSPSSKLDVNGDTRLRNTATTTIPLVVNGIASTTANLTEFQVDGAKKLEITKDGFINQNGTRLFHQTGSNTNTFFGALSGGTNTTGTLNSGYGFESLQNLTSGFSNTAIGRRALRQITTGSDNTAVGLSSLAAVTTGTGNNAFGSTAGISITTGTNNTFVGTNAGNNASQLATATNSTAIGHQAFTDKSNQMVFGNASVTEILLGRGSANVGIGTTSPTIINYGREFTVSGSSRVTEQEGLINIQGTATSNAGVGGVIFNNLVSGVNSPLSQIVSARSDANNSGTLGFQTSNAGSLTQKMTILPNGNVGIGTPSPDQKVTIVTSSGSNYTKTTNGTTTVFSGVQAGNFGLFGTISNHSTSFITNDSERMRIASDGDVGIGTASPGQKLYVEGAKGTTGMAEFKNTTTSGNVSGILSALSGNGNNTSSYHYAGLTAGVNVWYLYGNGTSSYSSDERLKKNIETTRDGYLEDLMKLRVVKYNWHNSEDGTPRELGLIAQEVEEVFPGLIQEHDILGVGSRKNIKHSVMEFIVIKAIQELKQEVETLKEELELLKAKVG
jgi:hypothetical protein